MTVLLFFTKKHYLVDALTGITDIHNHLLPNLDDRSDSLESTKKMIKLMMDCGITEAIATPHIMSDYYHLDVAQIEEKYKNTISQLDLKEARFLKGYAAEYMVDLEFDQLLLHNILRPVFKNYVLTEMSYLQRSRNIEQVAFDLRIKGLSPILAHPERYPYIENEKDFQKLIDIGYDLQLNLLSLLGHYGEQAKKKSELLLKLNMYSFVGTDAHKPNHLTILKQGKIKGKVYDQVCNLVDRHKDM